MMWDDNSTKPDADDEEKILWAGKPKGSVMVTRADRFFIPFGLFWFAIVGFMFTRMFKNEPPAFYAAILTPLTLMGLYFTIGRLFVEAVKRRNTQYVITNYRVIIKITRIEQTTQSINIKNIPAISFTEKKDGSGTITLGRTGLSAAFFSMSSKRTVKSPQLEAIPDVKKIYHLLVAVQNKAKEI